MFATFTSWKDTSSKHSTATSHAAQDQELSRSFTLIPRTLLQLLLLVLVLRRSLLSISNAAVASSSSSLDEVAIRVGDVDADCEYRPGCSKPANACGPRAGEGKCECEGMRAVGV